MRSSYALAVLLVAAGTSPAAEAVTFTKHVAPILFENCVVCHRAGEIGPFPLLTFGDAKKRAKLIAQVTADKTMPVWKPDPGHGDFLDARRLTDAQIATLKAWAEQGTPEGDQRDLPKPPEFKTGWQLGTPDIILKLPKPVTIPAEGRDLYIHFPFKLDIDKEIYVRGVEVRPSNPKVAHHAVGLLDVSATARKKAAADPRGGYEAFGGPGFVTAGITPGYVPGQTPRFFTEGAAITIRKGTDFVLQMHYHPSGKPETDRTEIGLYLTKEKPTKHVFGALLASLAMDIPPGKAGYKVADKFVLPATLKVDAVWAHMHLIGKEVRAWAELPDGTTVKLLKISDWDFNWQDTYRYRKPVTLPKGTVLRTEWVFDNTSANPRNPNSPPKRVLNGENSTDEMGGLWLGGEVATEGEFWALLAANVGHYFEVEGKKARK